MTTQRPFRYPAQGTPPDAEQHEAQHQSDSHERHGGHGLMMMLMCVPMVLLAGFLILTGAAGAGVFVPALLCIGMMAAMMYLMPGGHGHR